LTAFAEAGPAPHRGRPRTGEGGKTLKTIGLIEPCLRSPAKAPPSGPDWLHEIKHDGFRILAQRDANGARLYTRKGLRHGVGAAYHLRADGTPVIAEWLSVYNFGHTLLDIF
jgi:hypothetical protein